MTCPMKNGHGQEMLLAYVSGELDTESTARFDEHLAACPDCREAVKAQDAMWRALDAWEAPAVSPDFDRRLYERIEGDVPWWSRMWRPVLVRRVLPIGAMAAAIVAALILQRPAATPAPAVPQSAEVEVVAPDQAEHALQDMETMRELSRLMHVDPAEPKM